MLRYPLGRIRGKKNAPLREGTVPLPINSLGEPSKVIILKDAGIKPLPKPSGGHVKQKQVGDTSVRDKPDGASKGIKPSEAEILRAIAEENNVLGPEEVNRQIEGLKPGQGGSRGGRVVLPKDEFDTRASILHDGFTTAQLLGYLDRGMETPFDRMFQELAETEQDEKGAVHRVSRSSWTPGIRPVPQGSSNAAQRPHLPKKMGVVDKILRVNWKIDVLEEIESPGELEISGVQRWQLRLLVAGEPSKLDQIRNHRRVTISVNQSSRIIKIMAPKDSAEYAVEDIEAALQACHSLTVDFAPFKPLSNSVNKGPQQLFTDEDLALASDLSGAFLRRSDTGGPRVFVSGLDAAQAEDGRRVLLSMLDLPTRNEGKILTTSATKKPGILSPHGRKRALAYRDQRKSLARWSFPVPRSSVQESTEVPKDASSSRPGQVRKEVAKWLQQPSPSQSVWADVTPPAVVPIPASTSISTASTTTSEPSTPETLTPDAPIAEAPLQVASTLETTMPKTPTPATTPETSTPEASEFNPSRSPYNWSPIPHISTTATLGHILHRLPPPHLPESSRPRPSQPSSPAPAPTPSVRTPLPPLLLASLSASPTATTPINTGARLSFRFVANPWSSTTTNAATAPVGLKALTAIPELHITFAIPAGAAQDRARLESVALVLGETYRDVAMPDRAVDVRFARHEVLFAAGAEREDGPFGGLVREIGVVVRGQGRLRASSSVRVEVPRWTVTGAGAGEEGRSGSGKSEKGKGREERVREWMGREVVAVEYLWQGVEWRESVEMRVEGQRLRYVAVEGEAGGRRGEIRLGLGEDAKEEGAVREFVGAAFRLAERAGGSISDDLGKAGGEGDEGSSE
ncbi:hypothetical protein H2199_007630 [Coniosporium tulheliwenetii]|uniref:Uncharacterized protein n=1 Tax=Coniosporium tulheliwenetii TaxID=3383036 RepID=A0ACC2YPW5_9PEZI|nr:hypothetical protein H2199_007630 [Cladosporium sp. JES 115]